MTKITKFLVLMLFIYSASCVKSIAQMIMQAKAPAKYRPDEYISFKRTPTINYQKLAKAKEPAYRCLEETVNKDTLKEIVVQYHNGPLVQEYVGTDAISTIPKKLSLNYPKRLKVLNHLIVSGSEYYCGKRILDFKGKPRHCMQGFYHRMNHPFMEEALRRANLFRLSIDFMILLHKHQYQNNDYKIDLTYYWPIHEPGYVNAFQYHEANELKLNLDNPNNLNYKAPRVEMPRKVLTFSDLKTSYEVSEYCLMANFLGEDKDYLGNGYYYSAKPSEDVGEKPNPTPREVKFQQIYKERRERFQNLFKRK